MPQDCTKGTMLRSGDMALKVFIDGSPNEAEADEWLFEAINRSASKIPQVCYHPQLGPIQTCDACMVELDGKLVRACGTKVSEGMHVFTRSPNVLAAQREAFDRILDNHMLYCTVCDNNNGNRAVHNTTKLIGVASSFADKITHTPAYKESSVRMLVLKEKSESPLPRGNHRFGRPTPQRGVEVERKWKLANYRLPGPPF